MLSKRAVGFSLTELLIAIAILAILAAVAGPSFGRFIRNAQIRTATENFQAGLHLARSEALRRNTRVSFWIVNNTTSTCARAANGRSWVVSQDSPAGACNTTSSDTTVPRIIQTQSGNEGSPDISLSALDSTSTAVSCITFNGFGRPEASCTGGGNPISRVVFSATTGNSLELRVSTGGGIRLCNPSAATGDPSLC